MVVRVEGKRSDGAAIDFELIGRNTESRGAKSFMVDEQIAMNGPFFEQLFGIKDGRRGTFTVGHTDELAVGTVFEQKVRSYTKLKIADVADVSLTCERFGEGVFVREGGAKGGPEEGASGAPASRCARGVDAPSSASSACAPRRPRGDDEDENEDEDGSGDEGEGEDGSSDGEGEEDEGADSDCSDSGGEGVVYHGDGLGDCVGDCELERVDDNWIQCDGCEKEFHLACVGLGEEDAPPEEVEWHCSTKCARARRAARRRGGHGGAADEEGGGEGEEA